MLTAFVVVVLAYHALASIGQIDTLRTTRAKTWEIAGLVWNIVIIAWGGLLVWLIN